MAPPKPGLPNTASTGGAGTTRTFDQSASSSSAKISGIDVIDPCPISTAGDMIVIVPSAAIVTHGLSGAAVAARALPAAVTSPSATAKVNPAAPTISWRRVIGGLKCSGAEIAV